MFFAVVADIEKKEHFVEVYWNVENYENKRKKRIEEDSTFIFQSVFSTYKDAIREAMRISKSTYVKGWKYNEGRNETYR